MEKEIAKTKTVRALFNFFLLVKFQVIYHPPFEYLTKKLILSIKESIGLIRYYREPHGIVYIRNRKKLSLRAQRAWQSRFEIASSLPLLAMTYRG